MWEELQICPCQLCSMSEAEANEQLWLEELRAKWEAKQEQLRIEQEMLEEERADEEDEQTRDNGYDYY